MTFELKDIQVLFSGQWNSDSVSVSETTSSRVIDQNLESVAKETWQKMLREAFATSRKLWDSEIYRLEATEISEQGLSLSFSTIPFSIRLALNKHTEQIKHLGDTYAPKGLYTSCLVTTLDNRHVFIEKSDKYFTSKKYAWVGGVLSKTEKEILSGEDLFGVTKTEVKEELGISEEDVTSIKLLSGFLSENWNVCLLFMVHLNLTALELQERFAKNSDGEAVNLFFTEKDNLQKTIDIFDEKDRVKFAVLGLL